MSEPKRNNNSFTLAELLLTIRNRVALFGIGSIGTKRSFRDAGEVTEAPGSTVSMATSTPTRHTLSMRSTMAASTSARHKLGSSAGATLVIALVFFLICALIGSTALTAATVNTQATVGYKQNRQDEYTVGSAAQAVGLLFQKDVVIRWDWTSAVDGVPTFNKNLSNFNDPSLMNFWATQSNAVWSAKNTSKSYKTTGAEITSLGSSSIDTVYGSIEIDPDFNITIVLSLDANLDAASPYNETIYLQSIPSYDSSGRVSELRWESPVIWKTGS